MLAFLIWFQEIKMSKTLKTIQTLAKIARILCTIVFVCSIIGVAGCFIGVIGLSLGEALVKASGQNLSELVYQSTGMTTETLYAVMACSAVICAGEIAIAKFAEVYFKNELEAGTPFTFDGAKEMMRLGIVTAAVSLGTAIIASIVYGVIKAVNANVGEYDIDNASNLFTGIAFIIISFLCKHGAEISAQKIENEVRE